MISLMDMTHECIEWDGYRDKYSYGRVNWVGKPVLIHRVVWEEKNGPIPKGMQIRHKCDNPPCILLDHLEIGTQADNSRDMVDRGRSTKKTHCIRGHKMDGDNLGFKAPRKGRKAARRYCRECNKINLRKWHQEHC